MKLFYSRHVAKRFATCALCACFGLLVTGLAHAQDAGDKDIDDLMSDMGRKARKVVEATGGGATLEGFRTNSFKVENGGAGAGAPGFFMDDSGTSSNGGQAETSVACDASGQNIVVGFNDTRGFALNPVSVSGFMYSSDGGVTWTDGGQLPVNTGTTTIGATVVPQVFGDPEIVYLGGSNFAYFSIMVKAVTATTTAQTMCVHLSTDNGHTWKGPWEIPPATRPHGIVGEAADKEFCHRDPDTGRVMMSWSNFTSTAFAPSGVEISTTYSDNLLAAAIGNFAPTWSPRKIVGARLFDGQSSCPRFAGGGSNNVYVVWRTSGAFPTGGESVARSTDNGDTWSVPVDLRTPKFKIMDHVLGNDRTNNSPGFDVGPDGALYVVYADNNNNDGADVAIQKSTNGGATWSAPMLVNSRPGQDRAQWFPWVNVDQTTGRIHVFFYDQHTVGGGDMTVASHTFSDDGGLTWSPPAEISQRPWHAGYGNDTGQPNIGDYNQSISRLGEFMGTFAFSANTILFQEGQPLGNMNNPDVDFARFFVDRIALRLGNVSRTDSSGDGFIDPGETVSLQMPIESYANVAPNYTGITGTLTTATPNVSVLVGNSGYPDVATLTSSTNSTPFKIQLGAGFVVGSDIELKLTINAALGSTTLLYTLKTGTPVSTILYQNNFDAGVVTGWGTIHGGGSNTIPWVLSTTAFAAAPFGNTGRVFFHQNLNDGPTATNNTRFERLVSPNFAVPAGTSYVQVDFDIATNSEDEPAYNITAYDGFLVRVTDATGAPFLLRSVLAEAFAQDFTTGGVPHYPKHFPRNTNTAYFEDMSAWAGYSNGWKHVSMKLPGMAGTTFQLRFEYAQDSVVAGSNLAYPTLGVAFDNLVIKRVVLQNNNQAPVANAGPDQTLECVGSTNNVTLDGTASFDPDPGEPITYEWFQGATSIGTTATLVVDAPENATTTYKLVVTDAHGVTHSDTVDITIQDTLDPVVTLNGANPMKIFCGTTFVDPGATSLDQCDGDLTAGIVVTGTVGTTVGTYLVTYSSTDDANNTGQAVRTVKVIYDWSNVLQPVNVEGDSIFKLGSTVPVKFNLLGECADDIISAHLYVTKITNNVLGDELEAVSTSAADTGNTFRKAGSGWIFNLSTKGLTKGTYQLRIDLGDGELHTVLISLK